MSIAWRTGRAVGESGAIGMLLALGVVRAIEEVWLGAGERVEIKWPNDVLVDGKKVCGVLCERLGGGPGDVVIGGVGVNGGFAVRELPEEVHETATTLQDAVGQRVDVDDLRERVIERVWERVGLFESEGMRERDRCAIEGRLAMRGELVRVEAGGDRVVEGIMEGIGFDGRALVKSGGAVVGVGAGEVVRARRAAVRE